MNSHWKHRHLDEHDLHALLDGEIGKNEKIALIDQLQRDNFRRNELCELRNLKEMVKTAYDDLPIPASLQTDDSPERPQRSLGLSWLWASVASLVAIVSVLLATSLGEKQNNDPARMVLLDPDGKGARPAQPGDEEMRIVFHVSGDDPEKSEEILREVEGMLTTYGAEGKKLRIEIVAHGKGLALLREGLSTQKKKIAELSQRFPNLTFVACMNTVKRLKVEEGVVVNLIPEAIPIYSGVAHVVKRQQQGWIYIQV